MKRHFIVISIILYVIIGCFLIKSTQIVNASTENNNIYGKIITPNCHLLKSPTKLNNISNYYFLLEESYYVLVLNSENDYYYVKYKDLNGYVEKSKIQLVNENINNPYLNNIKFDVIKSCIIYSQPLKNSSSKITTIPLTENCNYYGKVYSEEIFENSGNLWYYCEIPTSYGFVKGYIHSSNTNNLSPITQNTEFSSSLISKNEINKILNLNLSNQTMLILIISIPIVFLIIILTKGFKKV